jgi:hypothetical protein
VILLIGFGVILGYRPNSVRNFDWLPFTPPLVASSVLQKYSRYRKNQTLRFGKLDCIIFSGSARCVVYEVIMFHLSHLGC